MNKANCVESSAIYLLLDHWYIDFRGVNFLCELCRKLGRTQQPLVYICGDTIHNDHNVESG